jgi:hypothetical protein
MTPQQRQDLSSLLLAFESEAIALYDLQRADADPEDFEGIDRDKTIAKRREALERIRGRILDFCDMPIDDAERLQALINWKER